MSLVHHALKSVLGPANTKATVRCRVQPPATVCLAMHDARSCFLVTTSAQDSAAKNAPSTSVNSVGCEQMSSPILL